MMMESIFLPKVRHLTTQSQTFNKLIGLVGHDIFGDITSAAMQSCFVLFFVGTTIRPEVERLLLLSWRPECVGSLAPLLCNCPL